MTRYLLCLCACVLFSSFLNGQSTVTFFVNNLPEDALPHIGIRGSIPPLDWGKSIPLEKKGERYTIKLDFTQTGEVLEFKFVQYNNDKKPVWESIQNRTFELQPDTTLISENKWNQDQVIDISTLQPISSEALLMDFELVKTMVLEVHPGTYRYNEEQQIARALEELKEQFSQPQTHGAAYLALSKLIAQIKCDHSKPGFNNQNKVINSIIHFQPDKVPFTFKWVGDKMVVIYNASESEFLKRGTAITHINGHSVAEIRDRMIAYVGADGATDQNRLYKMAVNGYDFRYNAFDVFFPLLYPFSEGSVKLEILPYGKETTQMVEVSTLTRERRAEILAERYPDFPRTRDDMWKFEILEGKVGLLTLNSFGLTGWKAMTIDYKQFLADAFAELNNKDIPYLVIDIRENNGGNDEMAEELSSYLSETATDWAREGRTRYKEFPASLKPYVQTWGDNPWYFSLKPKEKKTVEGYYIFKDNFSRRKKKSNKTLFEGEVFLLSSAANTSLAFYTTLGFRKNNIGKIVGQETGGNLNDINGGQILFLRLPHSQIEIDFPVMGGFALSPQPDSGVVPDIETQYTWEDIATGRDVELETIMNLIR